MGVDSNLHAKPRRRANFRSCNVSSYTSEVLEIQSDAPTLHVLFFPGNPGVILFYKYFLEFLYELLEGTASVTEAPDWTFMREREAQKAFLFGVDDHWGPLHLLEEISKQVPGMAISIERENHTHGFCCTEAGSLWVAQHVVNLIKNPMACSNQ
ncbi:hypothetical protein JHK85_054961 [Glycine max]|nr:hypothetical protein JHK86_054005 [Glycine max]KAG4928475.1 hypothetical protein JHK85_054961 [Glycine max]